MDREYRERIIKREEKRFKEIQREENRRE